MEQFPLHLICFISSKVCFHHLLPGLVSDGNLDFRELYSTLAHRRPTFTADMTTYYRPNMKEPLRPATTGPLNAGISIGQIDLHKQAATTSRQIIAKISKRITANF